MNNLEIIAKELLKNRPETPASLASFKRRVSKKYKIPCPSNIKLLKAYHKLAPKRSGVLESLLRTRPVRSLSGVVNISVLTKPYPCPGKCLYCPIEKGIPKSYVSGEPAVERAKRLKYSPYLQTKKRLEMLEMEGHPTGKAEIRIVGGTWSYYPKHYQEWFIKRCFEACNGKTAKNLNAAQSLNEKAEHRVVGLSVETRPDFIDQKEILNLRNLGVTKVELGVQSTYNEILEKSLRGHDVKATIEATKTLKDAGFKVSYQMMLNLPGATPQKDVEMFKALFGDQNFQPDLLKIYPCSILKEAPLYQWYLKRKYRPYSAKTLLDTIKKIKRALPYYVRVERITRDIPSPRISAGPAKISNLRQILKAEMQKEGWSCKCIRCREIREEYDPKEKIRFWRQDYKASEGKEIFLTLENQRKTKLHSLLKLRIPSRPYPATLKGAALIREVHTYGQLVPIAEKNSAAQHKGLGRKLIERAEKIARKEFNLKKIAVIAAVGTRDYFRKLGYRLENTYMVKYFLL